MRQATIMTRASLELVLGTTPFARVSPESPPEPQGWLEPLQVRPPGTTGWAKTPRFSLLGKLGRRKDPLVPEMMLQSSCDRVSSHGLFGYSSNFSFPLFDLRFWTSGGVSARVSSSSISEEIVIMSFGSLPSCPPQNQTRNGCKYTIQEQDRCTDWVSCVRFSPNTLQSTIVLAIGNTLARLSGVHPPENP